jgi:hypothetical protein
MHGMVIKQDVTAAHSIRSATSLVRAGALEERSNAFLAASKHLLLHYLRIHAAYAGMAPGLPILRLLLLLQCAVVLCVRNQRSDDVHTVAPLESCKPFATLDTAELTGFRNLNQLLQAKKRRHTELSWFIEFKYNPKDEERDIAMWNSSR